MSRTIRSEAAANRELARNARAAKDSFAPRWRGRFLKPRQGNKHGLNAWLLSNEYR
jgi:hypothetical protein